MNTKFSKLTPNQLAERYEQIKLNYINQKSNYYVKEIVRLYYVKHSWQLFNCFTHYHITYKIPDLILPVVSSFCLAIDKKYPLTAQLITEKLKEKRLTANQYTATVRREVEIKRIAILEALRTTL